MFDKILDRGRLLRFWETFVAKPDRTTAMAMAEELAKLNPADTSSALKDIVATLATRSSRERSELFLLMASWFSVELGRGLLKATAEVHVARSAPKAQPVPQHENVAHSLDVLEPRMLTELPATTPGGRDRRQLEALDLATSGEVTVDLIELERRTDDVRDVSTWAYLQDALAKVTSASSGRAYSTVRQDKLGGMVKGTTQEHLVAQIGFRAAKTQRDDTRGLSTNNRFAATYWRTNFNDTRNVFMVRLDRVKLKLGDILVNSPRVLRKLAMMVGSEKLAGLSIEPLVGKSGISVLHGTHLHSLEWDHILRELGATPSAYQLYELMDAGKSVPKPDFTVDTWADLMTLITSSPFSRLQKIALGNGELAPVCAMIEHLMLGLTDSPPKRGDTLTANALCSLSLLLDIVLASEANPSVAMRAVDLMMDEIGIVVAAAHEYTRTDYRETMRQVLLERAPSIGQLVEGQVQVDGKIQVDSHLMTSGMDALGTALWIALSWRGHDQVSRPTEAIDYYETGFLLDKLKKGQRATPRKDVLIAALNPSTPFDAPSADTLVKDVLEGLKDHCTDDPPFALILDTTIEIASKSAGGRAQLDVVLGGLKSAIADGRLEIFLCKSFQKYASFGTGKVAAGDLTLLSMKGNLESAYARSEALLQDLDLDLARHDEGQLVMHMLKHGHRDELALIRSAARNAKFVNEFCWPIDWGDRKQGSNYVDGIPLLLRSAPTGDVDELFGKLVTIDRRDSFSFLRTSYVGGIGGAGGVEGPFVRINPGHESKEAMVEYFYAFGHLVTSTPPGEQSQKPVKLSPLTLEAVRRHLTALERVPATDKTGIERYRKSIAASYCAFAVQNVEKKGDVLPLLIDFFATPAGRVTIETQRYLARELFTRVSKEFPKAVPTTLAALCRAAEVLPTWELNKIDNNLRSKLGGIGDSKEAARLRKLIG